MSSRPGTAPPAPDKVDPGFVRRNLLSSSSSVASHKTPVFAIAWSHNGRKLASASADGVVKVWSVALPDAADKKDKPEHDFVHSSKELVSCLLFNPKRDDQLLVVGAHITKVFNLGAKGSVSCVCEADIPDAISATWDSRDRILVAQLHNNLTTLELRKVGDKDRKRHTRKLDPHKTNADEITGVTFIDEGTKVLVATQHGVEVHSWPQFELLTVLDGHAKHGGRDGGVTAMAVTREEQATPSSPVKGNHHPPRKTRWLATGGNDTLICIWELQCGVPATIMYRPDEAVRALSFSADQALLAYCQDDVPGQASSVEVMDTQTGRHVSTVPLQRATEVMAFNPRYNKLLALAEPYAIPPSSSSYRDGKGKETMGCMVSIVTLKS